jgi:hypothetical protein
MLFAQRATIQTPSDTLAMEALFQQARRKLLAFPTLAQVGHLKFHSSLRVAPLLKQSLSECAMRRYRSRSLKQKAKHEVER